MREYANGTSHFIRVDARLIESYRPWYISSLDRYAGWVGTIAAKSSADKSTERLKLEESSHRLAACAGTSTCHIVQVSRV